jgi:hypothetical protein
MMQLNYALQNGVAGWQSQIGPYGKGVLDTLFVKLDKPSININILGLPENVVPIV